MKTRYYQEVIRTTENLKCGKASDINGITDKMQK